MNLFKEEDVTKRMKCPKKVTDEREWLKAAHNAIPEIPYWAVYRTIATPEKVVFELNGRTLQEFCHVIIDRTVKGP